MINVTLSNYSKIDPKALDEAINKAIQEVAPKMLSDAKTKHRYKTKTGNLRNATEYAKSKNSARLYINDMKAKYGKYIHSGFKKWAADPFIDNAIEGNLDRLDEAIISNIESALKRYK